MTTLLNGVNVDKLGKLIESVRHDPALGRLEFRVSSQWKGGFRTQHTTAAYTFGTATSITVHQTELQLGKQNVSATPRDR